VSGVRDLRGYLVAAAAARTADEGMAPALALLVTAAGREASLAGVLLAAAGLPHVVAGPVAGAVLDGARHRRAVLALAPAVLGTVLVLVALGLGHLPDAACVALVACAGCTGPLLTGGLSSELTQIAGDRPARALALDGATYNVAGIAGPAVVAATAAVAGAEPATIALGVLAGGGALLVLRLPVRDAVQVRQRGLRAGVAGAGRLWTSLPLRAVTVGSTIAFVGAGALPLIVVSRGKELGSATAGAALLAAMAGGALIGSLLMARAGETARPERRVLGALLAVGAALGVAAAGDGLALLGAGLVAAGLCDGVLFPSVLAVRTQHTAPGERGAVFTTAASLKIGAGAAGAALAGVTIAAEGATTALLGAAGLHVAGAAVCAATALRRPRAASSAPAAARRPR
jgi:hypothetical protein